ncbi:MAG: hypothetical protein ACYDG4_04130 [Desulfuromonadaceae bacterium]
MIYTPDSDEMIGCMYRRCGTYEDVRTTGLDRRTVKKYVLLTLERFSVMQSNVGTGSALDFHH